MVKRKADYPIVDILRDRWSPRALSGASLTENELMPLFEAARWAPSSYNGQPWRFIYVHRDASEWDSFFNLLVPFNQSWASKAAVLILVVSRTTFAWNNKPSRTHSFDTGAACENLALQGFSQGLVVHIMEGFDYDAARTVAHVPDGFAIEAMIAVGKPGNKKDLPEELQEREEPSDRNKLESFVFEGSFGENE